MHNERERDLHSNALQLMHLSSSTRKGLQTNFPSHDNEEFSIDHKLPVLMISCFNSEIKGELLFWLIVLTC